MRQVLLNVGFDLFLRLTGAALGGLLAWRIASELAQRRGAGSGVNPIEAALIALIITVAKEIVVAIADTVQKARELHQFRSSVAVVLNNCQLRSEQPISFHVLDLASVGDELRAQLRRSELLEVLTELKAMTAELSKDCKLYSEIYPATAKRLEKNLEELLRLIGR